MMMMASTAKVDKIIPLKGGSAARRRSVSPTTTRSLQSASSLEDEDERAALLAAAIMERGSSVRPRELGRALAERAQLITSVNWLGNHVPVCVLNRLGQELRIRNEAAVAAIERNENDDPQNTYAEDDSYDDDDDEGLTHETAAAIHDGSSRGEIIEANGVQYQYDAGFPRTSTVEVHKSISVSGPLGQLPETLSEEEEDDDDNDDGDSSLEEKLILDVASRLEPRRSGKEGRRASSIWRLDNLRASGHSGSVEGGSLPLSMNGTKQVQSEGSNRPEKRDSIKSLGEISELSLDFNSGDSSSSLSFGNSRRPAGGINKRPYDDDVRDSQRKVLSPNLDALSLPYASRHDSALLFVDISGFTKLSMLLNPECLSSVINAYFNLIVNQVTSHGGDVLKFAGDGLFAEWQASADPSKESSNLPQTVESRRRISLEDCVAAAATCGAKIVQQCSDYPVYANGASGHKGENAGERVASLNLHCGLGAGEIIGVHVGDSEHRREYLILGDPIDQVNLAASNASHGELLASRQALEIMAKKCKILDESFDINGLGSDSKPTLIARKNLAGFTPKLPKQQRRCSVTHLWEGWETDLLIQYRKLICLYAHPVVVENELHLSEQLLPITAQQRHFEEAEIRNVYVMFISMPEVRVEVSGNRKEDGELFVLLNQIMNATTTELDRFNGHLRQFIVDDKGLVLIATFGLRGSTFANLVTDRALPCTTAIQNALQNDLEVFNRIGATFGNAYCGLVGGMKRHEYAVMGPSVNLAARLMTSPLNPGILVDEAVRQKAGRAYAFNALNPVKAKGYVEPVPIYEPLSSMERKWGKLTSGFVGREAEIAQIVQTAKDIILNPGMPAKIIHVSAESGTGKTTLVVHAIEKIRRLLGRRRRTFKIGKHVCRESDLLTPFSIFQSILLDTIADDIKADRDDKSLSTNISGFSTSSGFESIYSGSQGSLFSRSSGATGCTGKASRLLMVCEELNAPPEFADLIGRHLLGLDSGKIQSARRKSKKAPSSSSILNFMEKIFIRFTSKLKLTIIALDDVHLMDEMSWSVLQRLFSSCKNILIICTSRPITKYRIHVDPVFWEALSTNHVESGRFIPIQLNRLGEAEIRKMIAKNLKVKEDDIDDEFYQDVYRQSRGMPHFANEILRSANRRSSIGFTPRAGNRLGWVTADRGKGELSQASVGELIVSRLDLFDRTTRNVLNLGAIFGQSFDLADIITVMQHFQDHSDDEKAEQATKVQASLDLLVQEGVLLEVCIGGDAATSELSSIGPRNLIVRLGDFSDDVESESHSIKNRNYQFCHDIWRESILKLMLVSHKQHIHRVIATVIEKHLGDDSDDYVTQVKLFGHWKAANSKIKAAVLALKVGKDYEELGLCEQGVQLYEDALNMWKNEAESATSQVNGFSDFVLNSMSPSDLELIIRLFVHLGKIFASMHRGEESVEAYQNALMILQSTPSAERIEDRTIVFPIFSGLFLALKFGHIEQDEECSYEQKLVARFVHETKLNGDPIHYTRALSMQAEMYGRLEMFDEAFEAFKELKSTYDVDKHSQRICQAYGSDRAAQCFSISTLWQMQLGNVAGAVNTCNFIFDDLIPKMDRTNVHNSCVLLYPLIWVMKDTGQSEDMLDMFVKHVVEPFDKYLGEGAFTFCLPIYDPIMMLLELSCHQGREVESLDEIIEWALLEDNLRFGTMINGAMTSYGRDANSLSSEICLLLAGRDDVDIMSRVELAKIGHQIARESLEFTLSKKAIPAVNQVKAIIGGFNDLASRSEIPFDLSVHPLK